jgi:hypothetical protein
LCLARLLGIRCQQDSCGAGSFLQYFVVSESGCLPDELEPAKTAHHPRKSAFSTIGFSPNQNAKLLEKSCNPFIHKRNPILECGVQLQRVEIRSFGREKNMAFAHLDILMREKDGNYRWLEAATDLEAAKNRLRELTARSPGEYVVFDQRTQQIVANTEAHTER